MTINSRCLVFIFAALVTTQSSWGGMTKSADFDRESHPGTNPIVANAKTGLVEGVVDGSWVAFTKFDFGAESNHFLIEGATTGAGGKIELRINSPSGPQFGTVDITYTGGEQRFRKFGGVLPQTVSGIHDLYLKFVDSKGSGGELFKLRSFEVRREVPTQYFPFKSDDDGDGVSKLVEYVSGMHPLSKDSVPLKVREADGKNGFRQILLRARADDHLHPKILVSEDRETWVAVGLKFVNGSWQTDSKEVVFDKATLRSDGLYFIRLLDKRSRQKLYARYEVETGEGNLGVYPPVPGLAASEYYSFGIQKVSALNSKRLEDVTNWETPFAWFTRCKDHDPDKKSAYYTDFIGSWTHTYCNFEVDPHTPIVIKITRLNKSGAPSGPIKTAAAHPARKVDSCNIIDGDVYVTMIHPALVAVDIDGQMDSRDTPRAIENGFSAATFPHRNGMDGVHAVTLFANPFIKDKPNLDDPGVYAVEPGTLPPADGKWKTLYFKPGVHKLSVDANGDEREWKVTDPIRLSNNKNYYIPGDAIVYGNFHDYMDNETSENIRFFGHGTLSGSKTPHFDDFAGGPLKESDHHNLRMLFLSHAKNCVYEGVTIADQASHGVYIEGKDEVGRENYIKWVKVISWRVNNDSMGVRGNSYIEDCFLRHQDDGTYIRGMGICRTVYWSDVNGTPLRCSFITLDRRDNFPDELPRELVVEDIDIIYCRGVFGNSDSTSFSVISSDGGVDAARYADGTPNTAQHIVFRNITISDPRPTRTLFGFDAVTDWSVQNGDWAGLRFENIDYQHPHPWGWRNRLLGSEKTNIKFWTFEDVSVGGDRLGQSDVDDPTKFETESASGLIFK